MAEMMERTELRVDTPFGPPSDALTLGQIAGERVAFLPRHGRGHQFSPTAIPARANIWALKTLGVEYLLSVSAVGSLREDYVPLDLVIPDQLFDHTYARIGSFFMDGAVAHIGFADPFCPHLSAIVAESANLATAATVHRQGTLVCIEGPAFSTRAESNVYRQWGMDIIGMTALPEARLAREAEICYATIACVTDYDTWHDTEATVSVAAVVANLAQNVANAQAVIRHVVSRLPASRLAAPCACATALAHAIMTDPALIAPATRDHLDLLIGKYV
jgi:5'-methylthioadenosine phosphorylase